MNTNDPTIPTGGKATLAPVRTPAELEARIAELEATLAEEQQEHRFTGLLHLEARYRVELLKTALAIFGTIGALAAKVEVDEDENGTHFRLGAFSRTVSASFTAKPIYGLRWSVDCESPGEAEADAIVALLAAAYARKMQKERPTL